MQLFSQKIQEKIGIALLIFLSLISLYVVVATWSAWKAGRALSASSYPGLTINVEGVGKAYVIPDTAQFSFTVNGKAETVAQAQQSVTNTMNAILEKLSSDGVLEEDIKTINYSVFPRYEFRNADVRAGFPVGNQVLVGYEVSHTNQVSVVDADKAGDLLSAVGSLGATDVSGLTFGVKDEMAINQEARTAAIDDAQAKARILAEDLGVKIVRVVGFYEVGSQDMYQKDGMIEQVRMSATPVAPQVSLGQSEVESRVNITFEIR
jgi:uncharacterized protein YggE